MQSAKRGQRIHLFDFFIACKSYDESYDVHKKQEHICINQQTIQSFHQCGATVVCRPATE